MRTAIGRCGLVAVLLATSLVAGTVSAGPSGGAQPPQLIKVLKVTGKYGIPAGAAMVAANVTAVHPLGAGFITVYPCDEGVPSTSNVNYTADAVVPNLVLSRIAADGTICVATSHVSDVLVDIVGYVPQGSAITPLASPLRLADTRSGGAAPRPAGSTLEVDVVGNPDITDDATLAMINVTAIGQDQPGYLRVTPCGATPGDTSSVNYLPRQVVPNLVVTRIGGNGKVCIYTLATAHVIVDVSATATAGFETLSRPVRILDTRPTGAVRPAGATTTLDIAGRGDVPDDATAAIYNLTAAGATAPGYATSHPCLPTPPTVSNLNYRPGAPVANGTITPLSATGKLCIFNLAPTHLVVDLIGYTRGTTHYVPITPTRTWDTRQGWQATCDWVLTGQLAARRLYVTNVRTAQRITIDLGNARPEFPPFLAPSCDRVYFVNTDLSGITPRLVSQPLFGGQRTYSSFRNGAATQRYAQMTVYRDRVIGVLGGTVLDVLTGETIAAIRLGGEPVSAAITPSGFIAARVGRDGTGMISGTPAIEVWDFRTGVRVDRFAVREETHDIVIAPDGRYVAIENGIAATGTRPTGVVVFTATGLAVDGVTYSNVWYERVMPQFAGRGVVRLCAQGLGLFEFDLYGALRQLPVRWDQLFDSNAGHECLDQFWT